MRILVVEDEKKVASFIKRGLEAANYSVDVEYDGEAGLNRLLQGGYDLVILDVMRSKSYWRECAYCCGGAPRRPPCSLLPISGSIRSPGK